MFCQKRPQAKRRGGMPEDLKKDYRKSEGHGNGGELRKPETALCSRTHQGAQYVQRGTAVLLRNPYGKCRHSCSAANGGGQGKGGLIKFKGICESLRQ